MLALCLGFVVQAGDGCPEPARLTQERVSISSTSGTSHFTVEVADTADARAAGLMCRTALAQDQGMLFVYPRPQLAKMWMKNTYVPLDILFVAEDGRIIKIAPQTPPASPHRAVSDVPVTMALELPAGTAARLGLAVGDRLHRENQQGAVAGKPVYRVVKLAAGLAHPWSLAFLPDGRMLVTEQLGRLRVIQQGKLLAQSVSGLPPIVAKGQGGLLDVVLHPRFKDNQWVYLSFAAAGKGGMGTHVGRGKLEGMRLTDWQTLFRLEPKTNAGQHFGSRLAFDRQGFLFVTIGERGDRDRAQDLSDAAGAMLRLHDDGRIPADNPFVKRSTARPEIYSYGHRNPQGAALHPETGKLWIHEHGPQGGDEINIIRAGANYGWPVITYGREYGTGFKIGEGTHKAGMEQPIHYWVPSIAPSGMAFYTGDKFPQWRGNLFVGALKDQLLARLELKGERVLREERLLKGEIGRIRDVRNGPDGYLYLLTDENPGALYRLEPR